MCGWGGTASGEWLLLPSEAMARSQPVLKVLFGSLALKQQESAPMSLTHVSTKAHADVPGLGFLVRAVQTWPWSSPAVAPGKAGLASLGITERELAPRA